MTKLAVLLALVFVAGCESGRCDPDQRYVHGLCFEIIADAGCTAHGDAGCVTPDAAAAATTPPGSADTP